MPTRIRDFIARMRGNAMGPADWVITVALAGALVAGAIYGVLQLLPEECGDGLQKADGQCVGVTEDAFVFDPRLEGMIQAVADENARVEQEWEDPEDGKARIPYVRVALMMPFTTDASSAMSIDEIQRSLMGAHAAQLRANEGSGPRYQLLLANDGKDLDHWEPVVDQLAGMADDDAPLVAAIGMPSSTPETKQAIEALSQQKIPAIGPVITSSDMNADYFFKTSPSNEHFAKALEDYLARKPGTQEGILVSDTREQDIYSTNLREVFLDRFGETYGLRQRQASYLGVTGEDAGIPQRFSSAAQKICVTGADTVFYAGRDIDLPHLIAQLAEEPACAHKQQLRLLKVGIGLEPLFTGPEITEQLEDAKITLVNAASVDPQWVEGEGEWTGLRAFLREFRKLERELGEQSLGDGYAIMYHDAFTVAAQAVEQAFTETNDEQAAAGDSSPVMPTKDDVYNTIIDMNIFGTEEGADCINCVRGGSGTFGFDNSPDTDKWPVCKPVPVVEYPETRDSGKPGKPYRAHEDIFDGACP